MHYNVIKTAAGARTRMRLPMLWKADAVAAEELPEAVFWVLIGGERVRVEKTPHSEDEYIFPALQAGQYAWDLVVDAQVVLHGVLKVRGSAVPPGGGEVCGTLLVDSPAMVLVLSPGPRGEVGPVGPQGLSAYEVALQHGYEGSEDKWADELSGAQAAATAAKEQATEAGKQAKAAAGSATTASEQATEAGKQAKAAAGSATTASEQATEAGKQAAAAAGSATTASEQATEAGKQAKAAADYADTAGKQAESAAGSATTASEQATAAANSATAAATAADAVKYDLLPMSVDWLHTQFVREIGDGNFAVTFNEEQQTLAVAFAHDILEEQCENLLQLCSRVTPQNVGVVREAVPTDFTELDYLESSGTQYIDTGVVPQSDTRMFIDCERVAIYTDNTINSIFGCRNTVDGNRESLYDAYFFTAAPDTAGFRPYKQLTFAFPTGRFTAAFTGSTVEVTGNAPKSYTPKGAVETSFSLYLFTINYGQGQFTQKCIFKIFRFSLSSPDGAILNLIPVLDENDEPCMWDTVSRRKLPNTGTGRFGYRIKGTDKEVPTDATTYSLRAPRDPYYVAPSGVYARLIAENKLEVLADTEETTGEDWVWFSNTAEAHSHFGIVPQEEFSTE